MTVKEEPRARPPQGPRNGGTRIQERNRAAILEAALDVFSREGFRAASLGEIAEAAGLSKPNLLYYYASKEAVHLELLRGLLDIWLAPLRAIDPAGEPIEEFMTYVSRKLALSRDMPRQSRLFANEVLAGAPHLGPVLGGELRMLVDEKAAILAAWMEEGRLARLPPVHLIVSVWALTQHYADFETQVRAVLGEGRDPYAEAETFLVALYRRLLVP
jgi:TetR/AcrR family transcriptional regulator